MNLYSIFRETVQRQPTRLAVASRDGDYTYAQLAQWVENLAAGFWKLGMKPGDRVAMLLRNRPHMLAVFWAAMAIGAVAIPLSLETSSLSLRGTLEDIEPRAIIYEGLEGCRVADLIGTRHPLLIGVDADDADIQISELPCLTRGNSIRASNDFDGDDLAVILYTSGTTGRPKGVPRTHHNTLTAAQAHIVQNQYESSDHILGVMPISHTMGLHLYVAAVLLGAAYVLVREFDPDDVANLIRRYRVTALYQTPFWYHTLLASSKVDQFDFSSVSKLGYAGSIMTSDVAEAVIDRFRPKVFINHYGSTEVYTHTVGNVLLRNPGSAGKAGVNAKVAIDGAQSPETVGEILVDLRSPEAFRGYWNRPDLTRNHIVRGWYRTGDLGYQDAVGNFYVVGRTDEVIITAGEHIAPQVVETVLLEHPKVLEVAVTGEPDNRWGQAVVAYIVPKEASLNVFELDSYCKKQAGLSLWARPRKYVFVRQIPKSPTGKILRRELANLEGGLS